MDDQATQRKAQFDALPSLQNKLNKSADDAAFDVYDDRFGDSDQDDFE